MIKYFLQLKKLFSTEILGYLIQPSVFIKSLSICTPMKEYVHNWDSIENANSHLSQYLFFSQALKNITYFYSNWVFVYGSGIWQRANYTIVKNKG